MKFKSSIISINNISGDGFAKKQKEASFFSLIKAGFAHKRKVLRKNLIDSGLPNEIVDDAFAELKIAPLSRAEDINFLTWIHLTDRLY